MTRERRDLHSGQAALSHLPHPPECTVKPSEVVPEGGLLGFSPLDAAALVGLPPQLEIWAKQTATALAREGGRGAAARRLLARDAAIRQARLRMFEGMLSIAAEKNDLHQVKVLDRLIDSEHSRLLNTLEQLARLDPAPSVRVSAAMAHVEVNTK